MEITFDITFRGLRKSYDMPENMYSEAYSKAVTNFVTDLNMKMQYEQMMK